MAAKLPTAARLLGRSPFPLLVLVLACLCRLSWICGNEERRQHLLLRILPLLRRARLCKLIQHLHVIRAGADTFK